MTRPDRISVKRVVDEIDRLQVVEVLRATYRYLTGRWDRALHQAMAA